MAKGKLLDENQPDSGTYILTDNVTATNFLANIPHSKGSDVKQLRNLRSIGQHLLFTTEKYFTPKILAFRIQLASL